MISNNDTRYAYAVARIHAIEKKLISQESFNWMIESKTALDAMKILVDAEYGFSSSDNLNSNDYENLLSEEYRKVYDILSSLIEDSEIIDVFKQRFDYQNIKVILKSEFIQKKDFDSLLIDIGTISLKDLKYILSERKFNEIPQIMQESIIECIDKYNRTKDPQIIDIILDKAYFKQASILSQSSKNEFLKRFIEINIDLENIKSLLRVHNLKIEPDFFGKIFIEGGSLSKKIFCNDKLTQIDDLIESIKFSQYNHLIVGGIENYKVSSNLSEIEKLVDNFIISFISKAKYTLFGVEPLVAYLIAKEIEMKNIRIIMVGKINNMNKQTIYERLRDSYV